MKLIRIASVAALLAVACRGSGPGARTRPPPAVTVAHVKITDVPVEVHAPVDLRAIEQAEVGAKTLGYLDAVLVDRGDRVRRGQLVAVVRPSDLPDQLTAARGALAQNEAAATLARANKERADRLAPTGFLSQQELQQTQTALAGSEASLAAARANVEALATRLGEMRITAPLNGYVAARRLDPGALVGPSAGSGTILTVQRLDVLRVFVPVNERDVSQLRVGQEARLELDALPDRAIAGRVVRISPAFDPMARTLDAEVQVPNPDLALRAGMYGRAAIVTDVHRGAIVVPASATQISNERTYVFVLRGDKVRRLEIRTGVDGGEWLEVTSGLARDDEIVTAGMDVLSDGSTVRAQRNVDPITGANLAASSPDSSVAKPTTAVASGRSGATSSTASRN